MNKLKIILPTLFFAPLIWADYSVGQLVDTYHVAKAANSFVIEPKEVKDRPFTVQVASHISEKEAIMHAEQLKVQEDVVFYYPNFVKSQVFFKVCVGRFETKEAAEAYRKEFVRRADEPFAVTITLMDRPGEDKKATKAQVASAKKESGRMIASLDAKPIDLKKEAGGEAKNDMAVKLMPKHEAKEVKKAVEAKAETKAVESKVAAPKDEMAKAVKHASAVAAVANVTAETGLKSYGLQVAAYPTEEMAKVESKKVPNGGHNVYYKTADVNGKTWYRVFVGKFKSFTEAQAFQGVYQEQHPGQTIIRKFIQ